MADNINDFINDNTVSIEGLNLELRKTWNNAVDNQILQLAEKHSDSENVKNILFNWHKNITTGYKYEKFSPHINGFYMIFMQHGTWYEHYKNFIRKTSTTGAHTLSDLPTESMDLDFRKTFPILATDIDLPDLTKEYTTVSSRLRNSFVAARDYFVSDFNLSYIENSNLDVMRYHEAWHKYINLIKTGVMTEESGSVADCSGQKLNSSYFIDVPYANAIWIAVFKPFTTDIQLLVKILGVMPVNMPLKQLVGNRSASKMTVLNMTYKSADMFYKFYDGTEQVYNDQGALALSFKKEILELEANSTTVNIA